MPYQIIFYEKSKQNERSIYQERSLYNIVKTWNNQKEYVTAEDPESQQMIASMEEQAAIISEIIKQRNALGLSQRDLASMCNIPQSSIARMESLQTTPSLSTLLKIMKPLGLHLTVTKQLPLRNQKMTTSSILNYSCPNTTQGCFADVFPSMICLFSIQSRIFPSMEIVTTCHGINLPLFFRAVTAACSSPPQQGTSMRTTVTL